ncbi:restriction endonuclease subunit S [Photobacterium leiognathi]|uniref:restriction endonuclease subunit S n=1 Tax=Photobacterium leiognathi TaxID=553611 RepID=UPI002981B786|nr:restriction endonuclease subunit S [Photobacterium leiognathi]
MSKYQTYPEYKDSGIDWLKEMPSHWHLRKAKHIFQRVQRPIRETDGVVTAFRDGQVTLRSNRRTDGFTNSLKEIGYQGVRVNDLLVHAMDGFAGAIGISDSDGKCSPVCSVCVPWNKENTNMPYYGYLVRQLAVTDFISSLAKGIRERSTEFRFSEFSGLLLAYPPVEEQTQIAAFLDHETAKIDTLIEKQQQLIELLKEKRQAVISHAVTKGLNPDAPMKDSGVEWLGEVPEHWVVSSIKYLSSFVGTGGTPKDDSSFTEHEDICWFTPGDFKGTLTISKSNKYVTKQSIARNDAKIYPRNSVLIIGIGATLGKVALCKYDFSCNQQINIVTPNNKIKSNFLAYALNAQVEQMKLQSNSSTIGIMNQEKTKQIAIAVPPINEQLSINSYINNVLEQFDKLLLKANKQIDLLQERRTALISAAVTGKIDVRNWVAPATSSDTNAAQQEVIA